MTKTHKVTVATVTWVTSTFITSKQNTRIWDSNSRISVRTHNYIRIAQDELSLLLRSPRDRRRNMQAQQREAWEDERKPEQTPALLGPAVHWLILSQVTPRAAQLIGHGRQVWTHLPYWPTLCLVHQLLSGVAVWHLDIQQRSCRRTGNIQLHANAHKALTSWWRYWIGCACRHIVRELEQNTRQTEKSKKNCWKVLCTYPQKVMTEMGLSAFPQNNELHTQSRARDWFRALPKFSSMRFKKKHMMKELCTFNKFFK